MIDTLQGIASRKDFFWKAQPLVIPVIDNVIECSNSIVGTDSSGPEVDECSARSVILLDDPSRELGS